MAAHYGSDLIVDLLKVLGIEYVALNPGSSFRGIHDSLVNYESGRKPNPEIILCCHEEIAVAVAHGYAKAAGKPMMVMAHGTVGLQHAAMGLYNAWWRRPTSRATRHARPRPRASPPATPGAPRVL